MQRWLGRRSLGGLREGCGAGMGGEAVGLAACRDTGLYLGILGVKGIYGLKGLLMELVNSLKF